MSQDSDGPTLRAAPSPLRPAENGNYWECRWACSGKMVVAPLDEAIEKMARKGHANQKK